MLIQNITFMESPLNEYPFNMISLPPFEIDPNHEDFDKPLSEVNLKSRSSENRAIMETVWARLALRPMT